MPATLLEERALEPGHDIVTRMNSRCGSSPAEAQRAWVAQPIRERLRVIKRARHLLAERTDALCAAIPTELARNNADTMCAEILPLLAAMEFLEREAETVLAPRRLGKRGRPFWLAGVWSEVRRVPIGRVLVIAPANYPLFLPGVQVAQALAAGNAVAWKPGQGGAPVARVFAAAMEEAGLPEGLLEVTEDSVDAAKAAIAAGVDKVFFTGSAASGRALMRQLAETLTPCVAELSGCDAVFVLPSADLSRTVKALAFGMRLNGSATCMAPRRIILVGADSAQRDAFVASLLTALNAVDGVSLSSRVRRELRTLLDDAEAAGASVHGGLRDLQRPVVLTGVTPEMSIAKADIFAPVLGVMEARDLEEALAMNEVCPYALTAAVFGEEREALRLAASITAGTVMVNDLIVPGADPRTPFGGRKGSGFGVTQGAEGLLEMTAAKVVAARRGGGTRHLDGTTKAHEGLFAAVIRASHLSGWRDRITGLKQVVSAAREFPAGDKTRS
jgi:aldehyde dehydrogenase (NAD+)